MAKATVVRFEVPFAIGDPILVDESLGIVRARLQGRRHSFSMDITLLDTADHRLLRAGVVLAHRVVDELGQWYLDAPGWAPWLPAGATQDMGAAGDLPQQFASLVRPFRRRAALGPVAAVTCQRRQFQLLGAAGEVLATVRDDLLAIRRGGMTSARYREVTITATGRLTRAQRDHLVDVLTAVGAQQVDRFPSLTERIGAPATGLTDFRGPFDLPTDATFEAYVRWVFARRLDRIMRADLALRSDRDDDLGHLRHQLEALRREVRALSFALEPDWRSGIEADVATVLDALPGRAVHQLGEEYFAVIDAVVLGVRAPKIGDLSHQRAAEVLIEQAVASATILVDRARSLTLSSPDERWAATLASAEQVRTMAGADRAVLGKAVKRVEKALDEATGLLRGCQMPDEAAQPRIDMAWDAAVAFQEGRRFERRRQEVMAARAGFLEQWPAIERAVLKARRKA